MSKNRHVMHVYKILLNLFVLFILLFVLGFVQKRIAFAAPQYTGSRVISNPSQLAQCTQNVCPHNAGDFCWNSEAPGVSTCGTPCIDINGSFGAAWSKYSFSKCYQVGGDVEEQCASGFQYSNVVYSTADKCSTSDGPSYLRSGFCDGTTGGIYKTCCNDSGGGMASQTCSQVTPSSGAPGYDGVCPSGSHSVTCGYTGAEKPTCGSSACSAAPTSIPTLTPIPTPTTSPCFYGECSASQANTAVCSDSATTKTCYNFGGTYCWWPTSCQAGTACYSGVCRQADCPEGSTRSICIQSSSCNL